MKIGHNKQSLAITLTDDERKIVGSEYVTVTLSPTSKERWMTLEASKDGRRWYTHTDATHPNRVEMQADLPLFGTETVQSWSTGPGILFGHKPSMNKPLKELSRSRSPRPREGIAPLTGMPGFDQLKEAVILINNFKRTYGSQLEMSLEDGVLRVRMMLEL